MKITQYKENTDKVTYLETILDRYPSAFSNFFLYGGIAIFFIPITLGTVLGLIDVLFSTNFLFFDSAFIETLVLPLMGGLILSYAGIIIILHQFGITFFRSLEKNISNFYDTEDRIENLAEIINSTEAILKTYSYYSIIRKIIYLLLSKTGYNEAIRYLHHELSDLIPYLKNFQGDFVSRIKEETWKLQDGKNELSQLQNNRDQKNNNIHSAHSITEVQKLRLEHQIGQFEKLEKVIIEL